MSDKKARRKAELAERQEKQKEKRKAKQRCHICGETGHVRRECPGVADGGRGQSIHRGKQKKKGNKSNKNRGKDRSPSTSFEVPEGVPRSTTGVCPVVDTCFDAPALFEAMRLPADGSLPLDALDKTLGEDGGGAESGAAGAAAGDGGDDSTDPLVGCLVALSQPSLFRTRYRLQAPEAARAGGSFEVKYMAGVAPRASVSSIDDEYGAAAAGGPGSASNGDDGDEEEAAIRDLERLLAEDAAGSGDVVAIGPVGIDYGFIDHLKTPAPAAAAAGAEEAGSLEDVREAQKSRLRRQLRLAARFDKPVSLVLRPELRYGEGHRLACEDLVEVLSEPLMAPVKSAAAAAASGSGDDKCSGGRGGGGGGILEAAAAGGDDAAEEAERPYRWRGVLAAYAGSPAFALAFLKQFPGMCIGFSGVLTYAKNKHLRELAFDVPPDRFVLGTDAPRHPPSAVGGGRGAVALPSHVAYLAEAVAKERRQTIDEVLALSLENAQRLFGCFLPRDDDDDKGKAEQEEQEEVEEELGTAAGNEVGDAGGLDPIAETKL
eukprot:g6013.t1